MWLFFRRKKARISEAQQAVNSQSREEEWDRLVHQYHTQSDQAIRDVRKVNKVLSDKVVLKIYKASHVR